MVNLPDRSCTANGTKRSLPGACFDQENKTLNLSLGKNFSVLGFLILTFPKPTFNSREVNGTALFQLRQKKGQPGS